MFNNRTNEKGDLVMTKLIEQLKRHEGLRLKPYKCTAGKWTIGYGRSLDTRGITETEAEFLLCEDISSIEEKLSKALDFWGALTPARQSVLINMAFNLGVNGLLKFKRTLSYLALGMYKDASLEMLHSQWAGQVKSRALELSEQMETGDFQ